MKIIAIKPLDDCNEKFLKGLKKNEVYLFDKAYSIDKYGSIEYHKEKDIQLFNQDDLQVNINAIVGKNGTGKSTLVELLLAVINNINYHKQKNDVISKIKSEFIRKKKEKNKYKWSSIKTKELTLNSFILPKNCISYIKDLQVEVIFEDLHIYKVKINKDDVKLFEHKDKDWGIIDKLDEKKFFYNILVNYSIHSLDSSQNSWIEPHFYNDCDTNIVIEPFRENGNINIQKEEKRVKERLIINLLEPETNDEDGYSFRQITDTLKADSFVALGTRKEYELYRKKDLIFNINDISEHINRKIENNIKNEKQSKTIKSVMPKNFFTDIILSNGVRFSQLSSGEKQKIYSINSIVYHIQRLDKKKYKHINLILDEIELYFHTELQRTYINDIIEAINKVETDNILGINITFITHSPFILSDIPESKILFLDKESDDADAKTIPKKTDVKTFGANIHNLLNSSFFMKNGLMGEFAKKRIKKIVKQLNDHKEKEKLLTEAEQQDIKKVIQAIGEPFLKQKLWNMYQSLFNDTDAEEKRLNDEMARIQKKLESLKK